jgi:hypothetical protein
MTIIGTEIEGTMTGIAIEIGIVIGRGTETGIETETGLSGGAISAGLRMVDLQGIGRGSRSVVAGVDEAVGVA